MPLQLLNSTSRPKTAATSKCKGWPRRQLRPSSIPLEPR